MRSITTWVGAFLLLFFAAVGSFAVDLPSLGYTVTSEETEGNRTVYTAEDSDGNQFTVTATGEISDAEASIIGRVLNEFNSWSSMDVSYLRVTVEEDAAAVLVVPARMEFQGKDLTPFLPSGMQFYVERLNAAIEDLAGFIERNAPD